MIYNIVNQNIFLYLYLGFPESNKLIMEKRLRIIVTTSLLKLKKNENTQKKSKRRTAESHELQTQI